MSSLPDQHLIASVDPISRMEESFTLTVSLWKILSLKPHHSVLILSATCSSFWKNSQPLTICSLHRVHPSNWVCLWSSTANICYIQCNHYWMIFSLSYTLVSSSMCVCHWSSTTTNNLHITLEGLWDVVLSEVCAGCHYGLESIAKRQARIVSMSSWATLSWSEYYF